MSSFYFSAKIWHEAYTKVDLYKSAFSVMFNTHLRLANYTEKIKSIDFFFIVTLPKIAHINPERRRYIAKEERLELSLALDYEKFQNAEIPETKQMMANLYLESIKTYPKIRGMKKIAFDTERFYNDVKAMFEKEGWLPKNDVRSAH
ncbi:MAG: hypothetical protein EAZ97_14620 [Bacteroidetes bacterium]|nr:MAG: hypothetical protein EAZ97_14620 [Bacteroidota bacterium]